MNGKNKKQSHLAQASKRHPTLVSLSATRNANYDLGFRPQKCPSIVGRMGRMSQNVSWEHTKFTVKWYLFPPGSFSRVHKCYKWTDRRADHRTVTAVALASIADIFQWCHLINQWNPLAYQPKPNACRYAADYSR